MNGMFRSRSAAKRYKGGKLMAGMSKMSAMARLNERTALLRRMGMKTLLTGALLVSLGMAAAAHAASITNSGDAAVVLVVVEGGSRMEVAVDPGATETICPGGCFVTLPNGDRLALTGGESVEISNGAAVVK